MDSIIENTSQGALENNSKIPTEDELLNELMTRINSNIIFKNISKDVKYRSVGGFNTVRFHNINGTNITYRESNKWIFKHKMSESGYLSSDVSVQNDVLDDFIDDNNTKNTDDYVKLNTIFNKTIENNINASNHAIAPQLYFAGFIKKETSNGIEFYFVVINETFTTNLHEYYTKKSYHNPQKNIDDDDILIRDSLVELLKHTVETLNIICFDVKPGNCVINLNEKREITDVRLIDWDANYCIHDRNLENNEDEQHAVFYINLIFMSIHFLMYLDYNIFYKTMEMNSRSIYDAQQYICEHEIYGPIYKMFMKNYFGANYNDGDIEKCKNIILELIEYSNTLLSKPKGGKKIVKQIFKQKTNKKTRKNRSTKNKTKKGGRMHPESNPNNQNTIIEELSIEQPRRHSDEYHRIMTINSIVDNLNTNSFSKPFITLYFIVYDNLQNESIVEQLYDDELDIIILSFIQLFRDSEMTDNEKKRVREFFLQNNDDYSVILKLSDDQTDLEMQHEFPTIVKQKLNEHKPLFTNVLES